MNKIENRITFIYLLFIMYYLELLTLEIMKLLGSTRSKFKFFDMTSLSKFFDVVLFLLSSSNTGPSFMSISSLVLDFFYKGLARNPEIGNIPV